MKWFEKIHQDAIHCSRKYQRSEYELVLAIQKVDAKKVFRQMGYASLFEYCVKALKLTESNSWAFINVARKSVQMPQIKKALSEAKVSVSQVRRVLSVITPQTQEEWLGKAASLTQRELEREVVARNPRAACAEKIRPLSESRSTLQCGLSSDLEKRIQRVREVLASKKKKICSVEEALEVMVDFYLEKNDPLAKAKRSTKNTKLQTMQRYNGQCAYIDPHGGRCTQRQFIDVHHITPRSENGTDDATNLTLLCKGHHQLAHHWLASRKGPQQNGPSRDRFESLVKDRPAPRP